ncbi:MAG: arginine repressor [Limnochordaceae bacterium]|uniref:Arginine repressor n=1 Tax=Carboxydichorda subterranea TaxID=3109565 RepID=A0ABZ1C231_9FIRM|nr:arginine repressor [Limnochorda sp. L945t]MBE3598140.1 arginine repressor [Limnochordaceae bacterium]WRP18337.1 arginine repressor [Limnochorda sp. L945t]
MKARRQSAILRIVRDVPVQTQEEILDHLRRQGIVATQATISRDIKELRLVKVPTQDGRYRYAQASEPDLAERLARARRALREYVVHVEAAGHIVLLRTLSGTANAVAAALDALDWPEVIGTIAGDDAILIIVRPRRHAETLDPNAEQVVQRISQLR